MTTSSTNELLRKSIVQIIVSDNLKGFGFFVAPNMLITCEHVISENPSDVKIHWGDQRLPVRVEESSEEADLALLSVELADHPYLPLSEDLVSFEVLHVHGYKTLTHVSNQLDNVDLVREQNCQAESPTFDDCLTVKGFAGNLEKIILEIGGGNIIKGMSGTPLFNPRTNGVCGLISGECKNLKAVTATNIKNALKFSQ